MTTAKLLLHCPDKPGILAEVTDFITVNKGNIIYLDQYVDHVENIFFMRIEWELKDFLVPQEKIEDYFLLYGGFDTKEEREGYLKDVISKNRINQKKKLKREFKTCGLRAFYNLYQRKKWIYFLKKNNMF